jgi:hypothetical protein
MTSWHASDTFIARRPAADRRLQTLAYLMPNPKSVSSQVSRRTAGVSPLEHHATSARHGQQVAIAGLVVSPVRGPWGDAFRDELLEVGEKGHGA